MAKKNGKKVSYSKWSEKAKSLHRAQLWLRGEKRKLKLIEIKGGGCEQCGYNKCTRALSFHHIDPSTKSFPLTAREIRGTSWEKLLKELDKCELLCSNCHMELHAKQEESIYAKYLKIHGPPVADGSP